MVRHRGRHSRGAEPLTDTDVGSPDVAGPAEAPGESNAGTPLSTAGVGSNGSTVGPPGVPSGSAEGVLTVLAAPDPESGPVSTPAAPAGTLPPVSRVVPVVLSPPLSPPASHTHHVPEHLAHHVPEHLAHHVPEHLAHHVPEHLAKPAVVDRADRRRRWPWLALVVLVVVAAVTSVQLARPFPAVSLQRALPATAPVSGATPTLPWPAAGEAAVAVPQLGVAVQSGPEAAVPIASLTKIMTAYVTLRDHPVTPDAQGPVLTLTHADQAEASADEGAGATNVPVQPGETLTERQLLDGLLVHSANNLADVLARWDAGTVPAFVAKMNATAAALGMTHTHYADASGLDPGTAGTAADELRVTQAAMAIPTFAAVVAQPTVTLPVAGVLYNYVTSVGTDGVVGVKSGFTQLAMGCLVLAGERTVAGHRVLVLVAVTGQLGDDPLDVANKVDEQLLDAVAAGMHETAVSAEGAPVGSVHLPWARHEVPVLSSAPIALLAWPGQVPHLTFVSGRLRPGMFAGTRVGTLSASIGQERVTVPVRVADALVGPSVSWRLERS